MTDWSDVEFTAALPKARKAQDFLPTLTDLLFLWDFVACAAAGQAALALYARYVLSVSLDFSNSGPFWRDIAFGSVIASLMLRSPASELHPRLNSTCRMIVVAERKCFAAFTVLIVVGVATRATNDLARLWLFSWFAVFAAVVGCTRLAAGRYLASLQRRGELREAVAIVGAAGARQRMAARIAGEADVVGLFGAGLPADGLAAD